MWWVLLVLTAGACVCLQARNCAVKSSCVPSTPFIAAQVSTGGITEFVPLPFVHMEAPIYLAGAARRVLTDALGH